MAALSVGISYDLSQSTFNGDNKELFFVKLTDSAFRAIEEYQKVQAKSNAATIQFERNEGCLVFPSANNSSGHKFKFSIDDIEGSQNSFECIKQSQGQLEVMGPLPHKLRIHAKDDVYETTRQRMSAAEEVQKNKCTREIKPNQTDIGRTVKKKLPISRISNIPHHNISNLNSSNSTLNNNVNNNQKQRDLLNGTGIGGNSGGGINGSSLSLSPSIPTLSPSRTSSNSINSSIHSNNLGASTIGNNLNNSRGNNLSSNNINNTVQQSNHSNHNNINNQNGTGNLNGGSSITSSSQNGYLTNGKSLGNRNNTIKNNHQSGSNRGTNPEIMKRTLRERLIHLLALRPYKKPELLSRITTDGIRERDRARITEVLKGIAFMRENTYHLHRHIWNDVHEDWPFYTEQDRQCFKRRKPQNLTPPLSSDGGSSTSGQSPNSAHNGSPPPAIKRPPLNNEKYGYDDPARKKPRISHYQREETVKRNPTNNITNQFRDSSVHSKSRSGRNDQNDMRSSSNYFSSNNEMNDVGDNQDMCLNYSVLPNSVNQRISSSPNTGGQRQRHSTLNGRCDSGNDNLENEDYTQWPPITSVEQRRRYKNIFDKDYQEYRNLFKTIEHVSQRFSELEGCLRREQSEDERYRIQHQIMAEYNEKMRDERHIAAKESYFPRFHYLHKKLAAIKSMVHKFDVTINPTVVHY